MKRFVSSDTMVMVWVVVGTLVVISLTGARDEKSVFFIVVGLGAIALSWQWRREARAERSGRRDGDGGDRP